MREKMVKTVAVIGAGASGLTAIKCCLDEGLQPTCYERTGDIGGLWNFTEEIREDQACVMRSTVINTSKEMMCYSDFPIPQEYPIFMHNKFVNKYFHLYAEKFNLKKYIKFDHEILSVCREGTNDKNSEEQWQLKVKVKSSGDTVTKCYDAVLVCTGHHATKKLPDFPGLKDFKGRVVHSHDYKDSDGYKNKRIVVVGIGNSGGDCAVELSRTAAQVYLSTRRGSWILNRVSEKGLPIDMANTRKVTYFVRKIIGDKLIEPIVHRKLNDRFDHAAYSLQPKHGFLAQHPMVNDDLPNRIICGSCIVKPNIKKIRETAVDFEDGTSEEDIDVILLATGYIFGFPFLDKSILDVCENQVELYKWVFPPSHNNIAVIGCIQPLGAIMPISEMQCRLALRVFKGEVQLPTKEQMLDDISMKKNEMSQRYVKSSRHTIQVDYVLYMDELAEMAGCKPNLLKLFMSDPQLALQCFLGPCTPYQYRLQGPGKWEGAKNAIFTQWQRTMYPLKTRPLGFKVEKSQVRFFVFFVVFIVMFAYIVQVLFMRK